MRYHLIRRVLFKRCIQLGEPAPAFTLTDLSDKMVSLSDFRGTTTLILFWNPGCGFCQQMLSDLKAWENKPPKGAPKLLVVSTGTVEANQEMGLHAPVVLDPAFRVGKTFGATGTPMAVLVDGQGKMASAVAAGAPAVLALAGQGQDTTILGCHPELCVTVQSGNTQKRVSPIPSTPQHDEVLEEVPAKTSLTTRSKISRGVEKPEAKTSLSHSFFTLPQPTCPCLAAILRRECHDSEILFKPFPLSDTARSMRQRAVCTCSFSE